MCLCFETIKIVDKKPLHVEYHNKRCNKTRKELFKCKDNLDLFSYITSPVFETCSCKIVYDKDIKSVEYKPMKAREFKSFTCIDTDINYTYKFLDRKSIDKLKKDVTSDDIIFTCKGKLLDTSIANIALFIDGEWLTPKEPLLKGSTRERLLNEGFLKEAILNVEHLKDLENFAIMNALLDFYEINNFSFKRNLKE